MHPVRAHVSCGTQDDVVPDESGYSIRHLVSDDVMWGRSFSCARGECSAVKGNVEENALRGLRELRNDTQCVSLLHRGKYNLGVLSLPR